MGSPYEAVYCGYIISYQGHDRFNLIATIWLCCHHRWLNHLAANNGLNVLVTTNSCNLKSLDFLAGNVETDLYTRYSS